MRVRLAVVFLLSSLLSGDECQLCNLDPCAFGSRPTDRIFFLSPSSNMQIGCQLCKFGQLSLELSVVSFQWREERISSRVREIGESGETE